MSWFFLVFNLLKCHVPVEITIRCKTSSSATSVKCCQLSQSIIRICPSHHKNLTIEVYGTRYITGKNMKPTDFTFRLSSNLVCSYTHKSYGPLVCIQKKASCVILLKFSFCVQSQSYRFGIKREWVNDIFWVNYPINVYRTQNISFWHLYFPAQLLFTFNQDRVHPISPTFKQERQTRSGSSEWLLVSERSCALLQRLVLLAGAQTVLVPH